MVILGTSAPVVVQGIVGMREGWRTGVREYWRNLSTYMINPRMDSSVARCAFQGFWLIGMVFLIASGSVALADEGMWLFNAPPLKKLKEKYQFAPDAAWLSHVMKSSVRFNSGGGGSFVSPEGLILTNHHVGADALQKFGDAQHDYIREGFYASSPAEERKHLPGLRKQSTTASKGFSEVQPVWSKGKRAGLRKREPIFYPTFFKPC
jgi:hypothetical protein